MKIIEFDDKGQRVETDSKSVRSDSGSSNLAPRPRFSSAKEEPTRRKRGDSSGIELHMFQTGTLKTKLKYIKMNQGESDFEIPVPWFLIKHLLQNCIPPC